MKVMVKYIRKGNEKYRCWKDLTTEEIEKLKKKLKKKPIGKMIAFEENGNINIGYSLCKKTDKYIPKFKPGTINADNVAYDRARTWFNKEQVNIPQSIKNQFKYFVIRAQKYFKDGNFPTWVNNNPTFLNLNK